MNSALESDTLEFSTRMISKTEPFPVVREIVENLFLCMVPSVSVMVSIRNAFSLVESVMRG